jgi:hypothetical protein
MTKYEGQALVRKGGRNGARGKPVILLLGRDLEDHREELFVRLVCDGMSLAQAYVMAGLPKGSIAAPSRLFRLPRLQERAQAILDARAKTGAITLPQVTDMLQRVFTGALHSGDFGPAHNAAFSLARLYGLVIDRSQVELIRRPSRDPDAPSETALADWVSSLPALPPPSPAAGPEPSKPLLSLGDLVQGLSPEAREGIGLPQGQFGNGAPARPVTGTPHSGAFSLQEAQFGYAEQGDAKVIDHEPNTPAPPVKKRVPRKRKRVPGKKGVKRAKKLPTAKQLFG